MNRLGLIAAGVVLLCPTVCGDVDPRIVRRELKHILSAPEYNRSFGPDAASSLWDRVVEALIGFLQRLGELISPGSERAGRIASVVMALLAIAAFLVLVALLTRWLAGAMGGAGNGERGARADTRDLPTAAPLIREAVRLAEAGDYRGAFRCAYLASIAHLDESQILRFERHRTNWEYMRELAAGGYDRPYRELRPLTQDFDRKFYGGEPCTREDYERAVGAFRSIAAEGAA